MEKNNKKLYLKRKKYKIMLIISLIIVILIFVILALKREKTTSVDEETSYIDTLSPEEKSIILGNTSNVDNVYIDNIGTKMNSSPNLKRDISLEDKVIVNNIILYSNSGKSGLYFNILNNNNYILSKFSLKITLLDNNGKETYSCIKDIESIGSKSTVIIEEIVEKDISNAYDIKIEKVY